MSEIFKNMMAKYKATHQERKVIKTYDLKNYFSTYLPDGVNKLKKTIRILPIKDEEVFWDTKTAHKIKVGNKYPVYACLDAEKGEPCPFCEAREKLLSSGDKEDKDIAKKYSKRQFYILKVIDRDHEEDGVKFWRISHDFRKTGQLDTLMSIMDDAKENMTDIEKGRDFTLTIARGGQNNTPVVQSVTASFKQTRLSDDPAKESLWLSDERTWKDVYSLRGYDYLAIILAGETPVFDKTKECFVSMEQRDAQKEIDEQKIKDELKNVDNSLELGSSMGDSFGAPKSSDNSNVSNSNGSNESFEKEGDDLPF